VCHADQSDLIEVASDRGLIRGIVEAVADTAIAHGIEQHLGAGSGKVFIPYGSCVCVIKSDSRVYGSDDSAT